MYTYYMTQPHPQQILSHGPSLSNMESSELISSQELKDPVGENNRVCIQMYPQRDSKALHTPVILLTTLLFTPALVRCFALTGKLSSNLISVRPNTAKDRQRADSLEVYKDVRTRLEDVRMVLSTLQSIRWMFYCISEVVSDIVNIFGRRLFR